MKQLRDSNSRVERWQPFPLQERGGQTLLLDLRTENIPESPGWTLLSLQTKLCVVSVITTAM